MKLNHLRPAAGSTKGSKRRGRGGGSGLGKTCGRGHKGQKSRSGGYHKSGFEGGQMPLQRRLPKFGFTSRQSKYTDEIRLEEIKNLNSDSVNLEVLREAGLISKKTKRVRLIGGGDLDKVISVNGLHVTKGARETIESLGGTVGD